MNAVIKRISLIALCATLSFGALSASQATTRESSPVFAALEATIKKMIVDFNPQSDLMEKVEQIVKATVFKNPDVSAINLLFLLKAKIPSLIPALKSSFTDFFENRMHTIMQATGASEADKPQAAQSAIDPISAKINTLCVILFKGNPEAAIFNIACSSCKITEAQISPEEKAKLLQLTSAFGDLVKQNVAKKFSGPQLDKIITFCTSPLFGKICQELSTLVDALPLDQGIKEIIKSFRPAKDSAACAD